MPAARRIVVVLGILLTLLGLLWIGQGLGYVAWPRQSFMIDQRVWADRGAAVAIGGLLLILLARRCRR